VDFLSRDHGRCREGLCAICSGLCGREGGRKIDVVTLEDIEARLHCHVCSMVRYVISKHENHLAAQGYFDNREDEHPQLRQPIFNLRIDDTRCICRSTLEVGSDIAEHNVLGTVFHAGDLDEYERSKLSPEDAARLASGETEETTWGENIDFRQVASWALACVLHHGTQCKRRPTTRLGNTKAMTLIFIDVENLCLAYGTSDDRYTALGYVWGRPGEVATLKTERHNFPLLHRSGSLDPHRPGSFPLPRTIRDAIAVTKELCVRYLWVDSLCIVQDDTASKMALIRAMDVVYSRAFITLVGLGTNADSPLFGVRSGTRLPVRTIRRCPSGSGYWMTGASPFQYHLSKYATRGWTFQEQALSHRRLIFALDQVIFECPMAWHFKEHREDPGKAAYSPSDYKWWIDSACLSGRPPVLDREGSFRDILEAYDRAVAEYSSRELTMPSDILNAFDGLAATFESGMGSAVGSPAYGLLEATVSYNILWYHEASSTPKR